MWLGSRGGGGRARAGEGSSALLDILERLWYDGEGRRLRLDLPLALRGLVRVRVRVGVRVRC